MQENIQAIQEEQLDCEWLELILLAKNMGITIEEIKTFLNQC